MKKSLKVIVSIIIGIVLMSSCGGGKSDVAKVKPEKIQITGDLSEYLQIIDGEYEVTDNFGAHLSIKVKALKALKEDEMKDKNFELSASLLNENGMPSRQEVEVIDSFGDELDEAIKGPDLEKPNALFLVRITWNGTRELIWRVFDPEVANSYLQEILNSNNYVRPFDYRMEEDESWELTKWHLKEY